MIDFWIPLYSPLNVRIDKKHIYGPHKIKFEIWINHKKIREIYFDSITKARNYMKKSGANELYNDGGCMIYCYINEIRISYSSFIEKKYYLD